MRRFYHRPGPDRPGPYYRVTQIGLDFLNSGIFGFCDQGITLLKILGRQRQLVEQSPGFCLLSLGFPLLKHKFSLLKGTKSPSRSGQIAGERVRGLGQSDGDQIGQSDEGPFGGSDPGQWALMWIPISPKTIDLVWDLLALKR